MSFRSQSSPKCQRNHVILWKQSGFEWELIPVGDSFTPSSLRGAPLWANVPLAHYACRRMWDAKGCGGQWRAVKEKQRGSFFGWEVPAIFTSQFRWISHSENTWRYKTISQSRTQSVFLNIDITTQSFEFNHKRHPGATKWVWNEQ